jgi:hypothetical protein
MSGKRGAVEYHLERKIAHSESSPYVNLYAWYLHELTDQQTEHGCHQIPWNWSLYFSIIDIALVSRATFSEIDGVDDGSAAAVRSREHLKATLAPSKRHREETSYSMFGTDRAVSDFSLWIEAVSEGEAETCSAYGGVARTQEFDFRIESHPDAISFALYLSRDKFERFAAGLRAGTTTSGWVRVTNVSGFYSGWSPAISTDHIKVLTNDAKGHPVLDKDGQAADVPRLGKVSEIEVFLNNETQLAREPEPENEWINMDSVEPVAPTDRFFPSDQPDSTKALFGILKSTRLAVWIGVALLVWIAVK